jgi:hypothetical protein
MRQDLRSDDGTSEPCQEAMPPTQNEGDLNRVARTLRTFLGIFLGSDFLELFHFDVESCPLHVYSNFLGLYLFTPM